MQILLFDMDSVLLTPGGYHRALQETIRLTAAALGYADRSATQEEIDLFEAAGVTSEWEASAMCACLLLRQAWAAGVEADLPDQPPLPAASPHLLPWPDVAGFVADLAAGNQELKPLARSEQLLVKGVSDPVKAARLIQLLRRSRRIDGSPTHHLFQELALGSRVFSQTYQREPILDTQSYLTLFDKPNLSHAARVQLLAWLDQPDHDAVIFTNRPSSPPDGFFDTPEAEFGRQVVGLDAVPIIGAGGVGWLATQQGLDLGLFLKPSGVHALAALAMVLMGDQAKALTAALGVQSGQLNPEFDRLQGAQVYVFEDSVKGLLSASEACKRLAGLGIQLDLTPLGISPPGPKRGRLEEYGAPVFDSLAEALSKVPGMPPG